MPEIHIQSTYFPSFNYLRDLKLEKSGVKIALPNLPQEKVIGYDLTQFMIRTDSSFLSFNPTNSISDGKLVIELVLCFPEFEGAK